MSTQDCLVERDMIIVIHNWSQSGSRQMGILDLVWSIIVGRLDWIQITNANGREYQVRPINSCDLVLAMRHESQESGWMTMIIKWDIKFSASK